ncbi:hypothetical protein JHK86_016378 [Glycine max]|nr:hypothetical protein JHK86_016378 [Glycine max]
MGWKRSGFEWERVNIYGQVLLGFLYICTIQTSSAVTDSTDAYILHYDPLFFLDGLLVAEIHVEKGGKAFCAMDHSYKKFSDLSNNNIGGNIPSSLPVALRKLVRNNLTLNVENNQFAGPIPPKLLSIPAFSLLDIVQSMIKRLLIYEYYSNHCMMHSTQMMTSKQDSHGILVFESHLGQLEP